MSKTFRESLNTQLQDPEFHKEWTALEPEYQIIRSMLNARTEKKITQKELSQITGIAQGDISRIERGNANPSLSTLKRIAAGLGMAVKIEFVPFSTSNQQTHI